MPRIIKSSRSKSKQNTEKHTKIFSYATQDSELRFNTDYNNTPIIKNENMPEFFQRRTDKKLSINSKTGPFGSFKKQSGNIDEFNEKFLKLKHENYQLKQIIISKDKEIENLNAINSQIIKSQESKNDVKIFF